MPLLWTSTAFILGILLASLFKLSGVLWVLLALAGIGWFLIQRRMRGINPTPGWDSWLPVPCGILIVSLCAGAIRYQISRLEPGMGDLSWYNDRGRAVMIGKVIKPPDRREKSTLLTVQMKQILFPSNSPSDFQPVKGMAILFLPAEVSWKYGDVLRVYGRPITPPEAEEFSYRAYLAQNGIFTLIRYPDVERIGNQAGVSLAGALYRIRETAYQFVLRSLPQPEAGLLAGIVLGIDGKLPEDLEQDFKETGTTHILVISGFNIAVLAEALTYVFTQLRLRKWLALLLNIMTLFAYTFMVGGDAPVVRAAIMGTVALIGKYLGRRNAGINSLVFAAGVMCLINPSLPWNISFQLSFAATFGVIFFGDKFQKGFESWLSGRFSHLTAKKIAKPIGEYFLITVAAQLTTLPIIAYHFQRISLSSFVTNIFILPAQPLIMILGGVSILLGVLFEPLGRIAALAVWGPLAYTSKVVSLFAQAWSSTISIPKLDLWAVILFYVLLIALPMIWNRFANLRRPISWSTMTIGLALSSIVVWRSILPLPDHRLSVIVLDVPGGPAYLVKAPGGGVVLIGGSSSDIELNRALVRQLAGRVRKIDVWLATSREKDNIAGVMGLLGQFEVEMVLFNEKIAMNSRWLELQTELEKQGSQLVKIQSGQQLDLGEGAQLVILANPDRGTAVFLSWNRFQCLIPGGTDPVGYNSFWSAESPKSVLILEDSDVDKNRKLLWKDVQPELIFVSGKCPVEWGWNAPNCVDQTVHGWLKASTDGNQLWLESEH